MASVPPQRHARGVDGLNCGDGVALDARDLDQSGNRITRQPKRMLHGDLGGVLHLKRGPTHRFGQPGCGHGASGPNFTLAPNLGPGDRRIVPDQPADRGCGQQELPLAFYSGIGHEPQVIGQNGRHNTRCPVGWSGHHTVPGSVLLVHRERIEVHPIDTRQGVIPMLLREVGVEFCRTALDPQDPGKKTRCLTPFLDAFVHRLPDGIHVGFHGIGRTH